MSGIIQLLQQHKEEFFKKYSIKTMALFGSYSRGEETKDIDVMVELNNPDARAFINLSYELAEIVKQKIDLVSKNGVKERYMKAIEKDLLYV